MTRVLLLGGTAEGRALAKELHPHVEIVSSLAGRVPNPALPIGPVRIGGFGGVEGLRGWLREERIDAVVDATHPFAVTITAHAAQVCGELGLPYLVLAPPPPPPLPIGPVRIGGFGGVEGLRGWLREERIDAVVDATHPFAVTITAHAAQVCGELGLPYLVLAPPPPPWDPGTAIIAVSDIEAADVVAEQGYSRVFLTTGRSGIAAFANSDAWFLIRVVTAPDGTALPRRHKLVLSRGPYGYHDEFALLREQRIDALVTKNSGGKMTRAKLDAAAALGISVVMIARPLLPAGVAAVDSVHRAAMWVAGLPSR
ncbi:putative precorrin-6X reductase CobK [Mycobacterium tuberculosis]|nr:putative precorrin-6X reductase CobK [Mycobacterium tuberculosis]